jgi:hypothetical protein
MAFRVEVWVVRWQRSLGQGSRAPTMSLFLVRDDGDGARGVVQYGLADRAEQQSGESAVAAGAVHNQLATVGGLDERRSGTGVG